MDLARAIELLSTNSNYYWGNLIDFVNNLTSERV